MKTIFFIAALLVSGVVSASSEEFGPEPNAATKREILAHREKAWRTWFSNDQAGFKQVVPGELVALGWGGGPWENRAQTLHQMQEFAATGRTIETLEFPKNIFQQYGEVIILYTSFRIVLKSKEGELKETTGRGTEIFVKRKGKWIHTGWHLDTLGA